MEVRQRKGKKQAASKKQQPAQLKKPEQPSDASLGRRLLSYLWSHEDASYLAFFRMFWGLVMAFEAYRFLEYDMRKAFYSYYANAYGWNCKYWMFEWVTVPDDIEVFRIFLIGLFICGILITIGFLYRAAAFLYFVGICYLFFIESASYLNHIYLTMWMSFVMLVLPCHCCYSIDAYRRPERYKRETLPKITLLFLQWLLIIVYAFAGVVKINEDWLRGEPLRHWVGRKAIWPYGQILHLEATCYFLSYGGMVYDLLVGPMLMWNRTFWLGIFSTLFFHISNKILFNIGIFPYMMIASTSLFFSPDWPRKLWHALRGGRSRYQPICPEVTLKTVKPKQLSWYQVLVTTLVVLFLLFWILFPLRHYTIEGDVVWNEAGHKYSWRMKLRDKHCTGDIFGYQPELDIAFEVPMAYLYSRRQFPKLMDRPWMLVQATHQLGGLYQYEDTRAEIYAYVDCQVNHRPPQQYTDRAVDLAAVEMWNEPYPWISSLEPLSEEAKLEGYPWNWEWNFNWLRGKHVWMPDVLEKEKQEQQERVRRASSEHRKAFTEFLLEEKGYSGGLQYVMPDYAHVKRPFSLSQQNHRQMLQLPTMPMNATRKAQMMQQRQRGAVPAA